MRDLWEVCKIITVLHTDRTVRKMFGRVCIS